MVEELRGGIQILRRRFQVQSPWLGSSEGGIFFRFRGRLVVFDELRSQGRHLHVGAPFSPVWELRGRLFVGL